MTDLRGVAAGVIAITVFVLLLLEVVKKVREENRDIEARWPDRDGW